MLSSLHRLYTSYTNRRSPDKELIERIAAVLGFEPMHIGYYKLAFSYRVSDSEQNAMAMAANTNERLEFLGDAVLGTIIAEYLYHKYPARDEGFLTKMRSKMVNRKTLNDVAEQMELDSFINVKGNTSQSSSVLGNTLEALIGAIYLDTGYIFTKRYIVTNLLKNYIDIEELEDLDDNYKSRLLEWCQKNRKTVSYELISRHKHENRDRFKIAVIINGERFAIAEEFTKKSAEQLASEKALRQLGQLQGEES